MFIAQPSASLSPYIKQYWGIESSSCINKSYTIKVVPHGLIELDLYLGSRPSIMGVNRSYEENSILSGQQKQFYDIHITDKLNLFSVIFQPAGAMMFFDMPMQEIYNQNIPLRYLFKQSVERLETELFEANNFADRVQLMNKYLYIQFKKNYNNSDYSRIENSIQTINYTKGLVDIELLASKACLSRKQFERIFLKHIGSTPKQFLRVVRFQNVIYNKGKNKDASLTELAYDCGYYDQSHMILDFKTLTGMTPRSYFSDCDPFSDYFSDCYNEN